MSCRVFDLTNTEFKMNNSEENGLLEKIMLNTDDSNAFLPSTNNNSQLKPLGDINIKLEDIIPCMYFKCFKCIYFKLFYILPLYLHNINIIIKN